MFQAFTKHSLSDIKHINVGSWSPWLEFLTETPLQVRIPTQKVEAAPSTLAKQSKMAAAHVNSIVVHC